MSHPRPIPAPTARWTFLQRFALAVLFGLAWSSPGLAVDADPPQAWRQQNDAAVEQLRDADRQASPTRARQLRQSALDRLDALLAGSAPDPASLARARFDRIVVLGALGRHRDVLEAVQARRDAGESLPAYVLATAGDAHAALRAPAPALADFEAALALEPGLESAHAGRVFALADLDRLDEAEAILRTRLEASPPTGLRQRDQMRLALVLSWRGQLDEAVALAGAVAKEAPEDAGHRIQHGDLLLQADRPQAALAEYEAGLARAPGARRGQLGRALARSRLGQAAASLTELDTLFEGQPGWTPVVEARRDLEVDGAAQLSWDWLEAAGPDRELAASERRRELRLTSARSDGGWRAGVGARMAEADFQGRRLLDRRQFVAASLERGRWRWRAEASHPDDGYSDATGWLLAVDGRASDAWHLGFSHERAAFDLPLRAREQGVTGDRTALAARWQPRAQHGLRLFLLDVDYSDGNRSRGLGLSSQHRLALGSRAVLTLEPSAYGSRQSRQDVAYFSPRRDLSLELAAALEHVLKTDPAQRWRQALEISLGQYRQTGFDAEPVARLGYRLQWDVRPGSRIFLRVARARRAFDGEAEYQNRLELGGWWSL